MLEGSRQQHTQVDEVSLATDTTSLRQLLATDVDI
jgi:hypothetical protein